MRVGVTEEIPESQPPAPPIQLNIWMQYPISNLNPNLKLVLKLKLKPKQFGSVYI
jgi:hypothetical protein